MQHVNAAHCNTLQHTATTQTAMNVFVDAETGQTPQKSAREYVLNAGSFQVSHVTHE